MRFLTPLLFLGAAAYVAWHNGERTDRVLILPFLDQLFPATAGDVVAQGRLTWKVLLALGVLFTGIDTLQLWRARRRQASEEE